MKSIQKEDDMNWKWMSYWPLPVSMASSYSFLMSVNIHLDFGSNVSSYTKKFGLWDFPLFRSPRDRCCPKRYNRFFFSFDYFAMKISKKNQREKENGNNSRKDNTWPGVKREITGRGLGSNLVRWLLFYLVFNSFLQQEPRARPRPQLWLLLRITSFFGWQASKLVISVALQRSCAHNNNKNRRGPIGKNMNKKYLTRHPP